MRPLRVTGSSWPVRESVTETPVKAYQARRPKDQAEPLFNRPTSAAGQSRRDARASRPLEVRPLSARAAAQGIESRLDDEFVSRFETPR